MYVELAYICDNSQPKPDNGLDNLFMTTDATLVNSAGEEHMLPASQPDKEVKPIEIVKELVSQRVKDATDINKRQADFMPNQVTLPAMLLLLVPSVFYYGVAGSPIISCFGFLFTSVQTRIAYSVSYC